MILRLCVVIRTFDNPRTISSVVKDVVVRTKFPVLVIDDGSETPAEHVLYSFEVRQAMEEKRVRVVRFPRRRGTGVALRMAMRELGDDGFTHMIVMRGDGSQSAKYIDFLVDAAQAAPWDVVSAGDLGSDYVLYPLFPMQSMRFLSLGSTFAVEACLRLLARGVAVQELRRLTPSLPVGILAPLTAVGRTLVFLRKPFSLRLRLWKPRTQISFAMWRPLARLIRPRAARVLHFLVTSVFLLMRPTVRKALREFYRLIEPEVGWRESWILTFQHVFGFVERHSVVRVRPEASEIELIPFLGRLAPVEIDQLPYIRELEKSILAAPMKWSRLYPFWSVRPPMPPPTRLTANILYEELLAVEESAPPPLPPEV